MSKAIDIAKRYFELSNESNMDEIAKMIMPSTTYSSDTTGVYLGKESIMEMMSNFHASFLRINWEILNIEETKPGVIFFSFKLTGERNDGQLIEKLGSEFIIVYGGKLQHIEVRSNN